MAAKQSPIAKLAEKPPGQQIAILVGVMAILGFLYFQVFLSSLTEELDSTESQVETLEDKKRALEKDVAERTKLINELEETRGRIQDNISKLPMEAKLNEFQEHLQGEGSRAKVNIVSIMPLPEEAVGADGAAAKPKAKAKGKAAKGDTSKPPMKVPVKMVITGTFHDIMHYFLLLHEMDRIVVVEDFSMTPEKTDTDEMRIKSEFRVVAYYQPPPETKKQPAAAKKTDDKSASMTDKAKAARQKREAAVKKAEQAEEPKGKKPGAK
jgi:Tfp pilus assembly protein PilO